MTKSFKKLSLLLGIAFIILSITLAFSRENQDNPFSIEFKLLNNVSSINSVTQFRAIIIFKNINHPTIEINPTIQYGFDGNDPFTVMAYDLNNNEVDISTEMDYDYIISLDLIKFKKGDSICDTISSNPFYHFKEKGTYKLRLLFEPENLYNKDGELSGEYIYSNWDTLTIK